MGPAAVVGGNRNLVHFVRRVAGGTVGPTTVGENRVLTHLGRVVDLGNLGDPTGVSPSLHSSLVFGKEGPSSL